MLQSDRKPGDDRGQVELFGETQFGTFDDHLPRWGQCAGFPSPGKGATLLRRRRGKCGVRETFGKLVAKTNAP